METNIEVLAVKIEAMGQTHATKEDLAAQEARFNGEIGHMRDRIGKVEGKLSVIPWTIGIGIGVITVVVNIVWRLLE